MRSTLTVLTLMLCTLLAAPLQAEEESAPAMTPEQMAMMTAYMEAATPGPEHAMLAEMAGTYDCTMKMRMDPASDWMESTATETIAPMLGGRFMHLHVMGEPNPMMPDGFEGAGLLGFNKTDKRYEQTWVDSMGTLMFFMSGTADEDGTITLEGSFTDPYLKAPMHQRWVLDPTDTGYVMEMYGPDMTGTEYHMGTLTGVRK